MKRSAEAPEAEGLDAGGPSERPERPMKTWELEKGESVAWRSAIGDHELFGFVADQARNDVALVYAWSWAPGEEPIALDPAEAARRGLRKAAKPGWATL